ncbi:MAG: hypothetical protein RBU25_03575 [Lentisphaeria bacterium]|jgi:hypothetical protein|nr:hypothetical protein [Lentisphaeria bacterium]
MDISSLPGKLRRAQIFRIGELVAWLCCSVPTARRRLRDWSVCRSINCNGAYYALPHVPCFDADGLWRCGEALFSRHGNLRETVRHQVPASPAGLAYGGAGGGSGDGGAVFPVALPKGRGDAPPSDAEAVLVLAVMIRRPEAGVDEEETMNDPLKEGLRQLGLTWLLENCDQEVARAARKNLPHRQRIRARQTSGLAPPPAGQNPAWGPLAAAGTPCFTSRFFLPGCCSKPQAEKSGCRRHAVHCLFPLPGKCA